MKRIYKSCVAVLLLLAMLLSCVPALAAGSSHSCTTLQKAEALKTLGLFQGTNKGFELEKTLTREQARKRKRRKRTRSIRLRTFWPGPALMSAMATRMRLSRASAKRSLATASS